MGVAIEELIIEAQKEGKFDDLPGQGKPLHLDPSTDAVVKGLLKEAKYTPEWVELAVAADALLERAAELLAAYAERHAAEIEPLLRSTYAESSAPRSRSGWLAILFCTNRPTDPANGKRQAVTTFNRQWEFALAEYTLLLQKADAQIRHYNRVVPFARQQRNVVAMQEKREEFAARFARLHCADGTVQAIRGSVPRLMPSPLKRDDSGVADRNRYCAALVRRGQRRLVRHYGDIMDACR